MIPPMPSEYVTQDLRHLFTCESLHCCSLVIKQGNTVVPGTGILLWVEKFICAGGSPVSLTVHPDAERRGTNKNRYNAKHDDVRERGLCIFSFL